MLERPRVLLVPLAPRHEQAVSEGLFQGPAEHAHDTGQPVLLQDPRDDDHVGEHGGDPLQLPPVVLPWGVGAHAAVVLQEPVGLGHLRRLRLFRLASQSLQVVVGLRGDFVDVPVDPGVGVQADALGPIPSCLLYTSDAADE